MASQYTSQNVIPVGVVMSLVGVVAVVGVNGIKKILKVGDTLNEGDKVVTGIDGEVVLGFPDGSSLALDSSSEAQLNSEHYDFSKFEEDTDISELIKNMQEAIMAGVAISAILEAVAASVYD